MVTAFSVATAPTVRPACPCSLHYLLSPPRGSRWPRMAAGCPPGSSWNSSGPSRAAVMLESLPRADSAPDSLPSPSSHDLAPTLLSPVVSQHQGVHAPKRPPPQASPAKSLLPTPCGRLCCPAGSSLSQGFQKAYFIACSCQYTLTEQVHAQVCRSRTCVCTHMDAYLYMHTHR